MLRAVPSGVGRHCEDRAGAGADAVDGRDDRLRAGAHRLDEVASHPCEREQARHVDLVERPDDLVHVAAGAEFSPAPWITTR